MRELLNLVLIGLLIVSVNILSITITCFTPNYGNDGHVHTFFHIFEKAETHAAHNQIHPDAHSENHKNCSLDSNSSMSILATAAACDLCIGQENFSTTRNFVSATMSHERNFSLPLLLLSPPPEPPELS